MPNVDVGQEGAIYQERLPERLLGRVDGFNSEDQVGRSELPVPVNDILDLSTKFKSLTWTTLTSGTNTFPSTKKKKYIYIYIHTHTYNKMKDGVNIQINKTTKSNKTVRLESNTIPLHAVRGSMGFLPQTNCHAPGQTPWLNSY